MSVPIFYVVAWLNRIKEILVALHSVVLRREMVDTNRGGGSAHANTMTHKLPSLLLPQIG